MMNLLDLINFSGHDLLNLFGFAPEKHVEFASGALVGAVLVALGIVLVNGIDQSFVYVAITTALIGTVLVNLSWHLGGVVFVLGIAGLIGHKLLHKTPARKG